MGGEGEGGEKGGGVRRRLSKGPQLFGVGGEGGMGGVVAGGVGGLTRKARAVRHLQRMFEKEGGERGRGEVLCAHPCQMRNSDTWLSGTMVLFGGEGGKGEEMGKGAGGVGFYGSFFGTKIKNFFPFWAISCQVHPKYRNNGLLLVVDMGDEEGGGGGEEEGVFRFKKTELRDVLVKNIQNQIDSVVGEEERFYEGGEGEEEEEEEGGEIVGVGGGEVRGLTKRDWGLLIVGSKGYSFTKNQVFFLFFLLISSILLLFDEIN